MSLSPALLLIVLVNVAVYAIMVVATGHVAFTTRELFAWGGNFGLLSLHGQPWRLLTATALHASPMHILGNMSLLLVTGTYLERRLGALLFLAVYVASGLAASVCSAWWHPTIVSIGASGAIAGLLGFMVALFVTRLGRDISGRAVLQTVAFNAAFSLVPGVDWTAHLAGFVTGLLLVPLLYPILRPTTRATI